jgi:molecular chaperone DnaK (HSP70)
MHPHTLAILWFLVIYAAWLGVAEETVAELITDPTKRVKGDVFEPLVNAAHGLIESDKKAQEKSVNTLELPISIKTLETPKQQQVTKAETAEEQVKGAITQISEFLKDD